MGTQIYKVKDPSGNVREIEGPEGATDEQILAKAKELFSPKVSTGTSLLHGLSQGSTFGFGDEIAGGAAALKEGLFPNDVNKDKGVLDRMGSAYTGVRDALRENNKQAEQDNPKTYLAGQVGGAVATSFLPVAGLGGKATNAATTLPGKMAYGAGEGAKFGAVTGLGMGEGDVGSQLKSTASGAALGGAVGGAFPAVAQGLGWVGNKVAQPVRDFAKNKALDDYFEHILENNQLNSDQARRQLLDLSGAEVQPGVKAAEGLKDSLKQGSYERELKRLVEERSNLEGLGKDQARQLSLDDLAKLSKSDPETARGVFDLLKNRSSVVGGALKGAGDAIADLRDPIKTLLMKRPGSTAVGGLLGGLSGGPVGAAVGAAGAGAVTEGVKKGMAAQGYRQLSQELAGDAAKASNPVVMTTLQRGAPFAATMHVLNETDPNFREKVKQQQDEESSD